MLRRHRALQLTFFRSSLFKLKQTDSVVQILADLDIEGDLAEFTRRNRTGEVPPPLPFYR
jgi:hypothetical protein